MPRSDYSKAIRTAVENLEIEPEQREKITREFEAQLRPLESDVWIYRIVVGGLVLTILLIFPLAATVGIEAAKLLLPVSTAAIGGIVGLLAPSPR